ncbi:MAG TPA: amino acid ABC transporter permease [Casimicrobiaceae bacterium]|nr:amino acid ABC transporter permease [Casimicrobiaceae bacterium]
MNTSTASRDAAPGLAAARPAPPARAAPTSARWSRETLLSGRSGVALLGVLVASLALAQVATPADRPSVLDLLLKWTPLLATGFLYNLLISFCAMALGTAAGFALGLARISPRPVVSRSSWIVVQFFRNAPWLVLLFFVMYLLPFQFTVGEMTVPFPDWVKATLGLALPIMANVAEILRGAVQSIPTAQWDAARSLAFSRRETLWKIILPQCLKRMLPPWMNWYAILTMATTLASIVGVSEVMTITLRITNAESRTDLLVPIYSYVLLWFFLYCYPISRWTRRLEARYELR